MEKRPQIQQRKLTGINLVIEQVGWVTLGLLWLVTVAGYFYVPDAIPTHFNSSGLADGFGEKSAILLVPVIASILFAALTVLAKFPHTYNYLVTITKENADLQYRIATQMLRYLRLAFILIFTAIVLFTILTARGILNGVGFWFLPATLSLIFVPMFFFILKSIRSK